jgi:hypothetical protein
MHIYPYTIYSVILTTPAKPDLISVGHAHRDAKYSCLHPLSIISLQLQTKMQKETEFWIQKNDLRQRTSVPDTF